MSEIFSDEMNNASDHQSAQSSPLIVANDSLSLLRPADCGARIERSTSSFLFRP
jgi:hypothetical protein